MTAFSPNCGAAFQAVGNIGFTDCPKGRDRFLLVGI
jgi:hypothetical protein